MTEGAVRHNDPHEAARWGLRLLLRLYVMLQVTHASSATPTSRCVPSLTSPGLGLRWNPGERVQSYPHPLWMFALSAVYFVTREA
ncbi:MAG TPA: hypothetical protein VFX59_30915 [Polyangiales bacterium]|nr:hypothetical protein [Polyangiales bacterium]